MNSSVKRLGKTSTVLGALTGSGFLFLRLSQADGPADYLMAIGLSIVECVAVLGVEHYAHSQRAHEAAYRRSQAQTGALESAIKSVGHELNEVRAANERLLSELKVREAEAFDVDKVAEAASCVVEANYRSAVTHSQRMLNGGAPSAFPPLALSIHREGGFD